MIARINHLSACQTMDFELVSIILSKSSGQIIDSLLLTLSAVKFILERSTVISNVFGSSPLPIKYALLWCSS